MPKILSLVITSIITFIVIYFLHQTLIDVFSVQNTDFVWHFYYFLTAISALMIINVLLVYVLKPKFVGYTFLIWSMLKLMMVMGYFIIFVLKPRLVLGNCVIFEIISLYFMYLTYEVFFSVFLLKEKIPA